MLYQPPKGFLVFLSLVLTVFASIYIYGLYSPKNLNEKDKTVLLAILARNKGHVLNKYLKSIEALDYDKKLITLYIDTNNNVDNTSDILQEWSKKHDKEYSKIVFKDHTIDMVDASRPHEWTKERLSVLGKIRDESLRKTKEYGCDYYFVVDCDNFIAPYTLKELVQQNKPIIAPLLYPVPDVCYYSNYFCGVNEWGYCLEHLDYRPIYDRSIIGTFKVPVVHCTYLINANYIDQLSYIDDSTQHEFVIFSRSARNNNVDQFICNEKKFGVLLHFYNDITLEEEKKRVSDMDLENYNII